MEETRQAMLNGLVELEKDIILLQEIITETRQAIYDASTMDELEEIAGNSLLDENCQFIKID